MLGGPAVAPWPLLRALMSPAPGGLSRCQPSHVSPLGAVLIVAVSDDVTFMSTKWSRKCQ
jgi:hypothetical protein